LVFCLFQYGDHEFYYLDSNHGDVFEGTGPGLSEYVIFSYDSSSFQYAAKFPVNIMVNCEISAQKCFQTNTTQPDSGGKPHLNTGEIDPTSRGYNKMRETE
jgi:hypothetical protein